MALSILSKNTSKSNRMEQKANVKMILYRHEEEPDTIGYQIDRYPLGTFDNIMSGSMDLFREEPANLTDYPFRDKYSKEFLDKAYHISFVNDTDPYFMKELLPEMSASRFYNISCMTSSVKETLILLYNSQRGIYTKIHDVLRNRWEFSTLLGMNVDLLFALCVDDIDFYDVYNHIAFLATCHRIPFDACEILNYNLRGKKIILNVVSETSFLPIDAEVVSEKGLEIFRSGKDFYSIFFKLIDQFHYDWTRDLPDIVYAIEQKYKNYMEYEQITRLYEPDEFANSKVVSHIAYLEQTDPDSRLLPVLCFEELKDGSIRFRSELSVKYPEIREILDALSLAEDAHSMYFLVVDVEQQLRSANHVVEHAWFGGLKCEECIEVYAAPRILQILKNRWRESWCKNKIIRME